MSNPRITRFNFAVGNEPQLDNFFGQLKKQAQYLQEEVQEIIDACDAYDYVEALDGVTDCWYIREYMDDLCMEQGMRVSLARELVCDNNDTKFTTQYTNAKLTQEAYAAKGVDCYIAEVEYEGKLYFTVRRFADGKVMKPMNFIPVDLTGCIPEELLSD